MAQLCSAVEDGHLYILAGQNFGTWQVSEQGAAWLRRYGYRIPGHGENTYLEHGIYLKLKDMGYLFIKGIEYDKRWQDNSFYLQHESEPVSEGLPLVLLLQEHRQVAWELALDLSALNEETWKELQSRPADRISASDALTSLSQLQLLSANYLLKVRPRLPSYQIMRESGVHIRYVLQDVPETPGLNSVWQGNVFSAYAQQKGAWRRRLPGRTVSFSGTVLWLAKSEHNPEWPGNAERLGLSSSGWQLWRLSVNEQWPPSWEELQRWFRYRSITITAQRQSLEVLSPPLAITADAQYVVQLEKQVLLGCYPPSRSIEGLDRQAFLSAELLERTGSSVVTLSSEATLPFSAHQMSYFRWTPLHPGEYRLRIQGDASADPLFIRVVDKAAAQPYWLHGLTCTIASAQNRQTLRAFNDLPQSGTVQVDQFAQEELATVSWALEPEQLPVRVTWDVQSQQEASANTSLIRSGEELTQRWHEYIWPALAANYQVHMVLDAGSFGRIALSIAVPQPLRQEYPEHWPVFDENFISQIVWLSRIAGADRQHRHIPIAASISGTLQRLREQCEPGTPVSRALERLWQAKTLPAWVCFRLRALLTESEGHKEGNQASAINRKQVEAVK